jgi:cysteine desulfurase
MAIYLDNAATTPVLPAALEAAWPWLTAEYGNPSSKNELGFRASTALEAARSDIAKFLGCRPSEITFTSGGTEANNFAVTGLALANPRGKHIISARTEHESVLQTLEFLNRVHGFEITWLGLNEFGEISLDELQQVLRPDTTLVTLMQVNNEIGTSHPILEISALAHSVGALVHTDAVQAVGWVETEVAKIGVDALSFSGHKVGAPKGSGAVFVAGRLPLEPILQGGGQEFGRRSGTENVAWAVALATALKALPTLEAIAATERLRQDFTANVLKSTPGAIATGAQTNRSAAIASFCFEFCSGEALLIELERQGVICSSGSACAAGSNEPSHVLTAIGLPAEVAQTAVRFSFSHDTTEQDLQTTLDVLIASIANLVG